MARTQKKLSKRYLWREYILIFVCLGTQSYQFDRLTKKLDELVEQDTIKDEIFAQIGTGEYFPKNYNYKKFINKEEFELYQDKADLVISHGGTGALIGASKKGKNIIAVPRLAKYGEHVDDHQLQIVSVLEKEGYIRAVYDMEKLGEVISDALLHPIKKPYQRESNIIPIICRFIDQL